MAQKSIAQILTLQQECAKRKDLEMLQNLVNSLTNKIESKNNQDKPEEIKKLYDSVSKNSESLTSRATPTQLPKTLSSTYSIN